MEGANKESLLLGIYLGFIRFVVNIFGKMDWNENNIINKPHRLNT
jgi:hypothetical protein